MVNKPKRKLKSDAQEEAKSSAWSWLDDGLFHEKQGLNFPQVEPSLLKYETPHSLDGRLFIAENKIFPDVVHILSYLFQNKKIFVPKLRKI